MRRFLIKHAPKRHKGRCLKGTQTCVPEKGGLIEKPIDRLMIGSHRMYAKKSVKELNTGFCLLTEYFEFMLKHPLLTFHLSGDPNIHPFMFLVSITNIPCTETST